MVQLSGLGSALTAARVARRLPSHFFSVAGRINGAVRVRVGSWSALEIFPRPSFMVRLFVPALRSASRA